MTILYACGLGFLSAALFGLLSYPPMLERLKLYIQRRTAEASVQLEDMFMSLSQHRLKLFYVLATPLTGLLFWVLTGIPWAALIGLAVGRIIPKFVLNYLKIKRRGMFQKQLVDGLLLLGSCLRAGLSMIQAFTVVAEEMPAPISQEFGLVLKETRMGVSLDEAMGHFKTRMLSDDTNLFVTAVLVARETGGDVTTIFARLVETIRERRKIKEKIKTLTFMARMQAIVMALLPIAFSFITFSMDKNHFGFFLHDPLGQMILLSVIVTQLLGAWLFMRFSKSPL